MLLTDLATSVAQQALGGQNTASTVALATAAIKASIRDWNASKFWNFCLKDTSSPYAFDVALCDYNNTTTIDAPSAGAFDFVNVGMVVSGTGIQTNTTVTDFVRSATTGSITSITISLVTTGGSQVDKTLTFTQTHIAIKAGRQEYNLPSDFSAPYSARLLTDRRLLAYIRYREWNRKVIDQDTAGAVEAYTVYNPMSSLSQGVNRLRVFRTPANNDTLVLQYFRSMNPDATTVDIPPDYIDMLTDYAIWRLVKTKNTEDPRLPVLFQMAKESLQRAMSNDDEVSEDEDIRLISQAEAWSGEKMLWNNGSFFPLDY